MTHPLMRCFTMRCLTRCVVLSLCLCGLVAVPPAEAQRTGTRQVILISVDGLTPRDYLHPDEEGIRIPNLRALAESGCPADGMTGVFPTVTYPSHTSMITGEPPSVHGVHTNTPLDPFGLQFGGWFYYAEKIQSPTLWQVLGEAGLRTAAISWPVTIGADVTYLIPEYRPVRTPEDVAMLSALSTRGLFHEMIRVDPVNRPMTDAWRTSAAVSILGTRRPDLLALHLSDLDGAQHRFGPHSPEAHTALEKIDAQIGEIRAEVARSGRSAETAWVIVSDHGFLPVTRTVNPMVALRDAGLITTGPTGRVTDWKVFMHNGGGSAFLEVRDPSDTASIERATALMRDLAADPANGIAKVYMPRELEAMHSNPTAFLGLEGARGYGFGSDLEGAVVTTSTTLGKHGYDPAIPELRAAMILSGAGIQQCGLREGVRIVDVAPTVAALLGVRMTGTTGVDVSTPLDP